MSAGRTICGRISRDKISGSGTSSDGISGEGASSDRGT